MKVVVSDPKTGKSYQREVAKEKHGAFIGKTIGETIEGGIAGLAGYTLKITGGSDKDGIPMLPGLLGTRKTKALLGKGPGVRKLSKGEKRKKMVLGNTVSDAVVQLNTKITEYGAQGLEELGFVLQPKEKKVGEEKEKPKSKGRPPKQKAR
jgi:small subunit ribosomal protein S6e